MSQLQRYYYTRGGLVHNYIEGMIPWCKADDVEMLEAYNERLRSMLQRIVHEAVKKRVDWTPTCAWLATSHNSDMYAIHYEINADLMNAIKAVLNNEEEQP